MCGGISNKKSVLHCGWVTHNLNYQTEEFRNDLTDNGGGEEIY